MTKHGRCFQKRKKIQADEKFFYRIFPVFFYVFFLRTELTIPDRMVKEKLVLLLKCT